jgi:ketosteroid isomerase-like protein
MHAVNRIALLAIALLAASCATTPSNEVGIREFVERFVQAVNSSNTDDFMTCFAPSATAFFPSGASASRRSGVDAIRKAVQPVFALGPRDPPARLADLVITTQDGMAVASFDASDGATHSRRTLVLRQYAGEWKIVHLHASNVVEGN